MDLTEILHLLHVIPPHSPYAQHTYSLKHTAEIIIKAASEQKNIRIANLMADLISPDPFASSIHSTELDYPTSNPIREGNHLSIASCPAQEVSALLSVGKLPEARRIIQSWSISRLCDPLVFTSLLTGFVAGGFFDEAVSFYAWCKDHTLSPRESAALLNTVSVSLLVQTFQQKKQPESTLALFRRARAAKVPLTTDVFEAVVGVLDSSHLWRAEYRERIRRAEFRDRGKWRRAAGVRSRREALQAALVLGQLRRAVAVAGESEELRARLERCVRRGGDGRSDGVVIDGSRLSPALLRVGVLGVLLGESVPSVSQSTSQSVSQSTQQSVSQSTSQSVSQSTSQSTPQTPQASQQTPHTPHNPTVWVKMGRNAEKEQALEKLLSSDLQPAIRFQKEEKAPVFVGGEKKVSVVSYVLNRHDVKAWRAAHGKDSVLSAVCNKHSSLLRSLIVAELHKPLCLDIHRLLPNQYPLVLQRYGRLCMRDIEAKVRRKHVGNVVYSSALGTAPTPHVVKLKEELLFVATVVDEVWMVDRVVQRPRKHAIATHHMPTPLLTAPCT